MLLTYGRDVHDNVEVRSVDGFRAKYGLLVCCNVQTVLHSPLWWDWVQFHKAHALEFNSSNKNFEYPSKLLIRLIDASPRSEIKPHVEKQLEFFTPQPLLAAAAAAGGSNMLAGMPHAIPGMAADLSELALTPAAEQAEALHHLELEKDIQIFREAPSRAPHGRTKADPNQSGAFPPGQEVEVIGLVACEEMNGARGNVVGYQGSNRVVVDFLAGEWREMGRLDAEAGGALDEMLRQENAVMDQEALTWMRWAALCRPETPSRDDEREYSAQGSASGADDSLPPA